MAWETRNRGRQTYYYRKVKRQGQVIGEYIGAGALAQSIAQVEQIDRERKKQQRLAWLDIVAAENAIDAELIEYSKLVGAFTKAVLLSNGCHQHKRQWRVRRREPE